MGTNHDLNAGIQAVSDSHNLETVYGINLIGNKWFAPHEINEDGKIVDEVTPVPVPR